MALVASLSRTRNLESSVAGKLPVIEIGAWAHDADLVLPVNSTTLQVVARQPEETLYPLIYQWVRVDGPPSGSVAFTPNATEFSDTTTATFGAVPGTYTLRVIVSDGFEESVSEVEVWVAPSAAATLDDEPAKPESPQISARSDRLIVRFEHDPLPGDEPLQLSPTSLQVMDSLDAQIADTLMQGRFGVVMLGPGIDAQFAREVLTALPEIRYAEADHFVRLNEYVPNDPLFDVQWALDNANDVDIDASFAWDQSTGSVNTIVAVMDTGIDYTHPDLYLAVAINNNEIPGSILSQLVDTNSNGSFDFYDLNSLDANGDVVLDASNQPFNQNVVADQNANGYIDAGDLRVATWLDGVDNDANGYQDDLTGWDSLSDGNDPMDTFGHGTHVSGIAAARGDNQLGMSGVNWRTQILPERFHDGSGGSISDAIQAIEHAVSLGADVINSSWGTPVDNAALKEAVQWAGDNGVVFVAAAGNGSSNLDGPSGYYPAAYVDLINVISVASVDPDGSLSSFSNYGSSTVDIAAPGASIRSTGLAESYILWSGTSMATPHVSGTVSLLAGLFPDAPPDWIVGRILSTAKTLPNLQGLVATGGMLNTFAAVDTLNIAGPRVVIADPIGDVVGPIDRLSVTFDSAMSEQTFAVDDVQISGPSGSIVPLAVNRVTDFEFEIVFQSQSAAGTYTLLLGPQVEDIAGRAMDQDRDTISGESPDDRFSVVFRIVPQQSAWTVDNGDASYSVTGSWSTYTGAGAQNDFGYKVVGSGATAAWTVSGLQPGQYQVAVTWQAFSNRTIDAPYTVLDGTVALGTAAINQRQAPSSFAEGGVSWQDIGVYSVTGDTLVVQLSDLAGPSGSYVIADAVRVERVGELPQGPEIQVLVGGVSLSDGTGSVDFGSTVVGAPVVQTITVSNVGTLDLALGTITWPTGYSLLSGPATTLLSPGQTTSFDLQLDAALEGSYAGAITIDSNDADENPFDLSASGTVTSGQVAQVSIVDNGDASYSVTGSWSTYTGAGAQNDFGYKVVGSGATAAWTVS
ncbi:MAG: S8 family serine peptidase, partial [Gammaproteobacteria bacterium]|nr:S8 family serine peptidase [Gammaproteobacteria bacterium]